MRAFTRTIHSFAGSSGQLQLGFSSCRAYCINLEVYFCYYCLAFGIRFHWMECRDCDLEPQRAFKSLSILNTSALQNIEAILICKEELAKALQTTTNKLKRIAPFLTIFSLATDQTPGVGIGILLYMW